MYRIKPYSHNQSITSAILLLVLAFTSCSTPERYEKKGDKFFAIGEYYEAAQLYRRSYSATPPKAKQQRGERAFRMAECFRRIGYTARAVGAYQNAARYGYTDTTTYFYLGEMQRAQGDYKGAAKSYKAYLESPQTDPALKTLSQTGLQSCAAAPSIKAQGSQYKIAQDKLFNSRRADYSPMLLGDDHDQIIFTSTRPQATGDDESGITGTKAGDFFFSKKDEKGKWKQPEPLQGNVNTAFDEGVSAISPDGQTLYFTICRTDAQYPRYAEIYKSSRSDASWGTPQKVELSADTLSSYAHPAVSPDGQWLYFSSDMPGGYGGYDIWRVHLGTGGYGAVENLGRSINSEGNEMFPSFRPNGDLYFSSDGRIGLGGLDIYKAKQDTIRKRWTVEHLPSPMNSEGDDFGMTFEGLHNRGFFSSNRGNGRGWDKIYTFECPEVIQTVRGWVYEQDGYELTKSVVYMVGDDGTNLKLGVKLDGSFEQIITPGVRYAFLATCEGFLNYAHELKVDSAKESTEYTLQFPLASTSSPVLVHNVFYDFDKATLTSASVDALDKLTALLNQNPNITIELSAHTDYRGSVSYNKQLSQRRSESVVNYLIQHGIKQQRLKAVGYGKSRPKVVTRKMAEVYKFLHLGDTLTEAYIKKLPAKQQDTCNALNRRTEFRVLRTTYGLFDEKGKIQRDSLLRTEKNGVPTPAKSDADTDTTVTPSEKDEDAILIIEPGSSATESTKR